MRITVQVFAALKEYFDPEFLLDVELDSPVSAVVDKLSIMQPNSQSVLAKCRIAVNEKFVSNQYVIKYDERIFIVPPSSGG